MKKLSGRKVCDMKHIFTLLCFIAGSSIHAQKETFVNSLEEVFVFTDQNVQQNSTGYKIISLNDSIIENNRTSFTSLIRFNTPIYMREYGAGGVSSASFRGTSASNTAVVWNGININSLNNGQTEFNSLTVNLIDNITVRSGGGTIKYGSGAIGGTIHLNTNLPFKQFTKHSLNTSVGSFQTFQNRYKFATGNPKFSLNFGIAHNRSDNNYKLLGTSFQNTNGDYKNLETNFNVAFKTSSQSKLKIFYTNYRGQRGLGGELPNPLAGKEKYQDFNTRILSVFETLKNSYGHTIKLAYLTQEYRYFEDKNFDKYDFGSSKRHLINYDFHYAFNHFTIESFSEYDSNIGDSNNIQKHRRNQFSQAFLLKNKKASKVRYNFKIRKDFNSDYNVPWVYALGAEYHASKTFKLRANGSKNYRVPTYNELYWPGQGNLNLVPETAQQAEIGIELKNDRFRIDLAYFYIDAENKIIWTPNGDPNRPNQWVPINIAATLNKGLELKIAYKRGANHRYLHFDMNYAYTMATNKTTKSALIFVPKHLANFNLGYSYKRWNTFYQYAYNGSVFTSEDNISILSLKAHNISNIGLEYKLLSTPKNRLSAGLKINNLFDEIYQITPRRPMPNRHFNIHIHYKF
jgi:vitamin B12 transporter